MLSLVKKRLLSILPTKIINFIKNINNTYFDGWALKSYSQKGEDMILRSIFENQATGFYVDVGAHHPKRFSNAYFFYKLGWNGINVDAMPGSMTSFNRIRPRDINLELAVSDKKDKLTYYIFNEPALNGFSKEISEQRDGKGNYRIISKITLETSTLEEILDHYLPKEQKIDFLSVDVEGFDLKVLKSNNWEKYRPKVVLAEAFDSCLDNISIDETYNYLRKKGYILFAKTVNTLICKLRNES